MQKNIEERVENLVALYANAGLVGEQGVYPTARQWQELLENPYEGKIYLITFYKLVPHLYKENLADLETESSKNIMEKLDARFGRRELISALSLCTWIGDDPVEWDFVSTIEFPHREDLISYYTSPEYIELNKKRPAAIAKQWTIVMQPV